MSDARSQVYAFVNQRGDQMARYGPPAPYQKMIEPDSDDDLHLHILLNRVEDDRAHREAVRLREEARQVKDGESAFEDPNIVPQTFHTLNIAADVIDPYEERDGQLVRKSDGTPVVL